MKIKIEFETEVKGSTTYGWIKQILDDMKYLAVENIQAVNYKEVIIH